MKFKHEHTEKPRHDYSAMPTPNGWDSPFSNVSLCVRIYGTETYIVSDVPPEKAREWAAEIIQACEIVESES